MTTKKPKAFQELWNRALANNNLTQDKGGIKIIQDRDFVRPTVNTLSLEELAERRGNKHYNPPICIGDDAGFVCPSCGGEMFISMITGPKHEGQCTVQCSSCGQSEPKRTA